MISAVMAARACAAIYAPAPAGFDHVFAPASDDGVCVATRRVGPIDLVVFRGSMTAQDWCRDFFAIPHSIAAHPLLGDVHAGFYDGLDEAFGQLDPLLRDTVVVTGHSLGAARAALFAGLLVAQRKRAVQAIVFGEPRPGGRMLRALLGTIPYSSYRNAGGGRHDLVTDVPTDPPFDHPRPLIDVYAPPLPSDSWGLFSMHHIELYVEAVGKV